ncbi:DUF6193 family natural product biosynthesis protein [Streptomyces sp. NPDC057438]|uniref:DUF6193 family natural product biosynthesis protein n=1 Tax=Streptomyces sp. NPDC057438 TaxID=3346133 RepID=UPI003698B74B
MSKQATAASVSSCVRLGPRRRSGDAELAEALYAQPALRVFFPWPSHGQFSLFSSTADPFL